MSTAEMCRINLVLVDSDVAAQAAGQLLLDLAIDSATSCSTGPFPAFGRKGDFRQPETLFPFTLMGDGRLDFGALAPLSGRADVLENVLEIRQTPLLPGEEVTCRTASGPIRYRIASILPFSA